MNKSSKPYFMRIPLSKLFIDEESYQRRRKPRKVDQMIAAGWNESKAQTLGVAEREDGKYAVWDGGHRLELAVNSKIKDAPCMVTPSIAIAEEAQLFVSVNRDRARMQASEILRAAITGKDKDAVRVNEIVTANGFRIATHPVPGKNSIAAAAALVKSYRVYGPEALGLALGVLRDVWGGEAASLRAPFIVGTARFVAYTRLTNDMRKTLVAKLKKVAPADMLQKVRATRKLFTTGTEESFALTVALAYNEGLSRRNRVNMEMFDRAASAREGWKKRSPSTVPGRAKGGRWVKGPKSERKLVAVA